MEVSTRPELYSVADIRIGLTLAIRNTRMPGYMPSVKSDPLPRAVVKWCGPLARIISPNLIDNVTCRLWASLLKLSIDDSRRSDDLLD